MEHMHQTISTMISMSVHENPPTTPEEASNLIKSKCTAAQSAMRASIHIVLRHQPGALAFGRNMIAPFTNRVNWDDLINWKQWIVDKSTI